MEGRSKKGEHWQTAEVTDIGVSVYHGNYLEYSHCTTAHSSTKEHLYSVEHLRGVFTSITIERRRYYLPFEVNILTRTFLNIDRPKRQSNSLYWYTNSLKLSGVLVSSDIYGTINLSKIGMPNIFQAKVIAKWLAHNGHAMYWELQTSPISYLIVRLLLILRSRNTWKILRN